MLQRSHMLSPLSTPISCFGQQFTIVFCDGVNTITKNYRELKYSHASLDIAPRQVGHSGPISPLHQVFPHELTAYCYSVGSGSQESATGLEIHATSWHQLQTWQRSQYIFKIAGAQLSRRKYLYQIGP